LTYKTDDQAFVNSMKIKRNKRTEWVLPCSSKQQRSAYEAE